VRLIPQRASGTRWATGPATLLVVAALAACGGDDGSSDGYGPEGRADFVEACSAGMDAEACGCFYDRLEEDVPYERFEEVDRALRDDPTAIPDDIADLAVRCSAEASDPG
jgi:hypothetical protein